jgi:hypothetical protein
MCARLAAPFVLLPGIVSMSNKESIIEKIRKLLALAEGNQNEHELSNSRCLLIGFDLPPVGFLRRIYANTISGFAYTHIR